MHNLNTDAITARVSVISDNIKSIKESMQVKILDIATDIAAKIKHMIHIETHVPISKIHNLDDDEQCESENYGLKIEETSSNATNNLEILCEFLIIFLVSDKLQLINKKMLCDKSFEYMPIKSTCIELFN